MNETIHVVIVENLRTEAEMSKRKIRKAPDPFRFRRFETRKRTPRDVLRAAERSAPA